MTAYRRGRMSRSGTSLTAARRFYCEGIGLAEKGSFADHDGYDGVFLALPGDMELEITTGPRPALSGGPDDLLVLYVSDPTDIDRLRERMTHVGAQPVPAENPYWDRWGVTYQDDDGHRTVIAVEP